MEYNRDAVQVFIGGGNAEWLPTAVLEFSIRRHTARLVQVTPLAGVEMSIPIPVPKDPRNRAVTSFSFQRFLIPQALDFQGRGIYLDSDMLVVGDIGELWDNPFPAGSEVQMCPGWQSAVMLIDAKIGWRIDGLINLMDRGGIRYKDLVNVKALGGATNSLPPEWNCTDRPDPNAMDVKRAKLLHYTDMNLQPWLHAKHPHGALWTTELLEAIRAGFLRVEDVLREIEYGHVRPSLALVVDCEPPYADAQFVMPHHRPKAVA